MQMTMVIIMKIKMEVMMMGNKEIHLYITRTLNAIRLSICTTPSLLMKTKTQDTTTTTGRIVKRSV